MSFGCFYFFIIAFMMDENKIILSASTRKVKQVSKNTRRWRRIHYYLGLSIAILLLISAITGVLLGWKKDIDVLQPPTIKGDSRLLSEWLPLSELEIKANEAIKKTLNGQFELDRMDVRPSHGVVKITYTPGYWEVQVDGATGKILLIEKRYSDLIEQIHDGSIISDGFKLVSMNFLGISVLIMILSGVWLWYAPRKIRRLKR